MNKASRSKKEANHTNRLLLSLNIITHQKLAVSAFAPQICFPDASSDDEVTSKCRKKNFAREKQRELMQNMHQSVHNHPATVP